MDHHGTGSATWSSGSCCSQAGAILAAHFFGQVHLRVNEWLDPWQTATNANPGGYQLSEGWFALGTGGIGGTGLGLDPYVTIIPENYSDMIFAVIGIEMGMIGAAAVVVRLHPPRRRSACGYRPARSG